MGKLLSFFAPLESNCQGKTIHISGTMAASISRTCDLFRTLLHYEDKMAANSAKTTILNSKFLFAVTLNFLSSLVKITHGGCPFQNPFWFVEKPVVVSVFDENGEMVANKIRVMWGRMENFKCVDYFQVKMSIVSSEANLQYFYYFSFFR